MFTLMDNNLAINLGMARGSVLVLVNLKWDEQVNKL